MSETKEIQGTLEEIARDVKHFQEKNNESNGKMTEQLKLISDDITKNIEEVNAIKAKQEADEEFKKKTQETLELIEKQASRIKSGDPELKENPELEQSFNSYIRKGVLPTDEYKQEIAEFVAKKTYKGASEDWLKSKATEIKTHMVGNDPRGGFWVRPEISNTMINRMFETSPMRQSATVISIGTDQIDFPIDDNEYSTGGWVSEVEERTETEIAKIGKLEIPIHEQYAMPKATQKMLDDAGFNVEGWISNKSADKMGRTENTAFISGDGAGKPKGILSYPAWSVAGTYERGKIEQVNSGKSGEVDADTLVELQNSLIEDYQSGAEFMMKRATFTQVMQLKAADGHYLLDPRLIFSGADKILLGQPVKFADDMAAVAADSLSIAYGNFKIGYTIVDRFGIRVLRDPYTTKGSVLFYTTKRVGGAVTNYEAIKLYKLAA